MKDRVKTTILRHGPDFYRNSGKKGGDATVKLYGKDWMKMLGSEGNKIRRLNKTKLENIGE